MLVGRYNRTCLRPHDLRWFQVQSESELYLIYRTSSGPVMLLYAPGFIFFRAAPQNREAGHSSAGAPPAIRDLTQALGGRGRLARSGSDIRIESRNADGTIRRHDERTGRYPLSAPASLARRWCDLFRHLQACRLSSKGSYRSPRTNAKGFSGSNPTRGIRTGQRLRLMRSPEPVSRQDCHGNHQKV